MNNLLISIPFDEKNLIITKRIATILTVNNLYYISKYKENRNLYNTSGLFHHIPKFANADKYKKHIYQHIPDFFDYINDLDFKLLESITYRWFRTYKISNKYSEITILTEKIIRYWYDFIINNEINFIFLGNYPHTPHDYSIFLVAKLMKIKFFFLIPFSSLNNQNRFIISTEINGEFKTGGINNDDNSISQDLVEKFYKTKSNLLINQPIFTEYDLKYISNKFKVLTSFRFRELFYFIRNIIIFIKGSYNERIIKRYLIGCEIEKPTEGKYVFFPLHLQPEATTLPTGGRFVDQLRIIELVSLSLPTEYKLIVKEHPAYWYSRWRSGIFETMDYSRSIDFYQRILALKNVELINHNFNSIELLENAAAVISISGTIILEANILGIRAFVFGNNYSRFMPFSVFVDSLDKLKYSLDDIKSYSKIDRDNLVSNYLVELEQNSILLKLDNHGQLIDLENSFQIKKFEMILNYLLDNYKTI